MTWQERVPFDLATVEDLPAGYERTPDLGDALVAREVARIKPLFDLWLGRLGLWAWSVDYYFSRELPEVLREGASLSRVTVMEVASSWEYLSIGVTIYCVTTEKLDLTDLAEIIIHEIGHVLVQEICPKSSSHQERVVTQIQRAISSSYAAGYQDGQEAKGAEPRGD